MGAQSLSGKQRANIVRMELQVPLLLLIVASAYAIPSPNNKLCSLVKSRVPTNPAMCFLEPECEQKCTTVNERKCRTRTDQQCSTVNEQQCTTVQEQECRTVDRQQCSTTTEQQCTTTNEQQCSTRQEQQCRTVNEQQC